MPSSVLVGLEIIGALIAPMIVLQLVRSEKFRGGAMATLATLLGEVAADAIRRMFFMDYYGTGEEQGDPLLLILVALAVGIVVVIIYMICQPKRHRRDRNDFDE